VGGWPQPGHEVQWRGAWHYVRMSALLLAVAILASAASDRGLPASSSSAEDLEVRLGGTLGLTGVFTTTSWHAMRGLELFARRVNGPEAPIRLADGRRLRVSLRIEDDKGDPSEVERLYTEMVGNNSVDLFLGPYSSGLSLRSAAITDAAGKISVLHAAANPSIYTDNGFRYVFSTNVMASNYMKDGLRILAQQRSYHSRGSVVHLVDKDDGIPSAMLLPGTSDNGSKRLQLVAAWPRGDFNEAVCTGAIEDAQGFGYHVAGNFSFRRVDLTSVVRRSILLDPDVLVLCGHKVDAVNMVVTSRALGLSPKAMLVTQASTQAFIEGVGAPNANYILAPVAWHKDMPDGRDCKVFGSASKFAEDYHYMFGLEPTYHSANAAVAGIALVAAVAELGSVGPSDKLREALLGLNKSWGWSSIYGKLHFYSENGTIMGKSCVTEQIQPLSLNYSREERYTKSNIRLLDSGRARESVMGAELLYPAPSWEQKELEVFPCDAGSVVNRSDTKSVTCQPCPVGRHRARSALACSVCGTELYADKVGLPECRVCPEGADCGTNKSLGQPAARVGFFLLPEKALYRACEPPDRCLGGNVCAGHNRGILCAACAPGYTSKGLQMGGSSKFCGKCPSQFANVITIVCVVILFTAYITLIAYMTLASGESVRAIHSIVLKKVVNHVQLVTTAWQVCEFNHDVSIRILADASQDPLETFVSLDCLFGTLQVHLYEVRIMIGMLLAPVVLICNFSAFLVLHFRARVGVSSVSQGSHSDPPPPPLPIYTSNSFASDSDAVSYASRGHQLTSFKHSITSPFSSQQGVQITSLSGAVPTNSSQSRVAQLAAMTQAGEDESVSSSSKQDHSAAEEFGPHALLQSAQSWAIVLMFLLHPMVVKMLATGITCVELDRLRLQYDLEVLCGSEHHRAWFLTSIFGLSLYGLGIPLIMFVKLYRVRNRLLDLPVRRIYGFLYNGFEPHCYYFEVVYMLRKVLILLSVTIPVKYARTLVVLCLSFFFLALHIFFNPYDNRYFFVLDRLETMSLLALNLTLQLRLFMDLLSAVETSAPFIHGIASHPLFAGVLLAAVSVCQVYFWVLAFWTLLRHSILRHLSLKRRCAPQDVNGLQSTLLLMEPQGNKLTFDLKSNTFDLSALSQSERHFFFITLCDTLECYIDAYWLFHPARVTTAVRKAIERCMRQQDAQEQNLLQIMHARPRTNGWITLLWRWHGELLQALSAGNGRRKHGRNTRVGGLAVAGDQLSSLRVGVKRFFNDIGLAGNTDASEGVTIEALQNSLMQCWPDILGQKSLFLVRSVPLQEPLRKHPPQKHKPSMNPRTCHMADETRRKSESMSLDDVARAFEMAEKPFEVSSHSLARRHAQLTQEAWLLRAEVVALHTHLAVVQGPAGPEAKAGLPHAAPTVLVDGLGGARGANFSASTRPDDVAALLEGQVLDLASCLLAGRWREPRRDGVDAVVAAAAARLRAAAARLLTIRRAWRDATVASIEEETQSHAGSVAAAEAVASLRRGEGWLEMGAAAAKAAAQLAGAGDTAASWLRNAGLEKEGAAVEAIAAALSQDLLPMVEDKQEDVDMDEESL